MTQKLVSAVFDSRSEAERAVSELRAAGVSDGDISLIGRGDDVDGDAAKDVVGKTAAGAGVGALLGVAALAIPGIGPLVAAGAIAEAAAGGAAVTGTLVGAAAGGLAGALTDHGVSDEDARYYEEEIKRGGTFVSVDTDDADVNAQTVSDILYRAGGHSSGRARMTPAM